MLTRLNKTLITVFFFIPAVGICQYLEKVSFGNNDSTGGYYLAVPPRSNNIKGAVVLFSSFYAIEDIIAETKLHNVTYANDMLTVFASLNEKFYADSAAVEKISTVIEHVVEKYSVDTAKIVLGAFDIPGNIILRYTELTYQNPSRFKVLPKAVFAVDCTVDLFGLWHWCERQIGKDYDPENVGSAKYILNEMGKKYGTIYNSPENYTRLSPFQKDAKTAGNEQYLKNVAIRLYYDTDIDWQLKTKRNSFYDTNIPDGSELINKLLLLGNTNAEFVSARQPGKRSNGTRNPTSFSIVDEAECIQWIKRTLNIFDVSTWKPPYLFAVPNRWSSDRFPFPLTFARQIAYKGVEDVRFSPGWGDTASEEHWSYAFLWWLEGVPKINEDTLRQNLNDYYAGLVAQNIIRRKIPADKVVPTNVSVKKIKTTEGDLETYSGKIGMLNYMTQLPMTLNCLIHVKSCTQKGHTTILVQLSPKPLTHAVWKELNGLNKTFMCGHQQ